MTRPPPEETGWVDDGLNNEDVYPEFVDGVLISLGHASDKRINRRGRERWDMDSVLYMSDLRTQMIAEEVRTGKPNPIVTQSRASLWRMNT